MSLSFRQAVDTDQALLYRLTREAIGPYVAQLWGWEEEFQQARFARIFDPARWQIIIYDGVEVGGLELEQRPEDLFLANLLLFPEHQRKGIGTAVIQRLLREAHAEGRPVRLRVLKVNPARGLYERLGFLCDSETDTHYLMSALAPA